MKSQASFARDSAGSIMSTNVPIYQPSTTCQQVIKALSSDVDWDDIHHLYIISDHKKLEGYVSLADAVKAAPATPLRQLLKRFPEVLHAHSDQERAVFMAVKNDLDAVPVVDKHNVFLGAVTAKSILDIMHNEHVEDVLFATGIRRTDKTSFAKLASARLLPVFRTRAPWLIAGSFVGVTLGLILSQFEESLEKTIALAYFVPVIAYIANSVGVQSEAITVRALATVRLRYASYLLREIGLGLLLGVILGALAATSAWLISHDPNVALTVSVSLMIACVSATTLAASIPILFKLLGKDPALGSGPIAAAVQDILSILIYFACATVIIGT